MEKADEEITIASYVRKCGRKPLPKYLPRETIIHDLSEEQKTCSCEHQLHKIGEEKSMLEGDFNVNREKFLADCSNILGESEILSDDYDACSFCANIT